MNDRNDTILISAVPIQIAGNEITGECHYADCRFDGA